ncbi:MAG: hypothetical protein O3B13_17245 [Planctomycetota bacterium]|nr:hypothetical protein [Planctomycetota bacterium]MDA1164842.1 hypothetical protein [Planctomycetota bacterium]
MLKRIDGTLLLGIWLLGQALIPILELSFRGRDAILALLAIAAGVLLIAGRAADRLVTGQTAKLLLAGYLIAHGVLAITGVTTEVATTLLAIAGIIAGVLLIRG